ncbi:MAG: hypothetical protein ACLGG9_11170 [Thermoleophilia bacterium]|jgi:hypothetical protein
MSETDETAVVEEAAGEAAAEAVAEAAPEAVAQEGPAADEQAAVDAEAIAVFEAPAGARQARVYLCERGHRTVTLWSTPANCRAHINRRDECGRQLYPIGELPDQVQKALNPLKASKKASKKG